MIQKPEQRTVEAAREAHLRDKRCQENANKRGQVTFSLVEQDVTSPRTIAYWILENIESAPAAKLYDALESALVMREFPNRKRAD